MRLLDKKSYLLTTSLIQIIFCFLLFSAPVLADESKGNIPSIKSISAGYSHSVALTKEGKVYTWGNNTYGQLGDGTLDYGVGDELSGYGIGNGQAQYARKQPTLVKGLNNIVEISAGWYQTIALRSDGTVWTWGNIKTDNKNKPTQVIGLSDVKAVAGGENHIIALKNDGTAWTWGRNTFGQLGDGTTTDRVLPVKVKGIDNIIKIYAGAGFTLALKKDGTVWAWGYNSDGQLGTGDKESRKTPVQVKDLTGVSDITAGKSHAAALKEDGTVWTWGDNEDGQLGNGENYSCKTSPVQVKWLEDVVKIAAAKTHSMAIEKDGSVRAWGENDIGWLGCGTNSYYDLPSKVENLADVKT